MPSTATQDLATPLPGALPRITVAMLGARRHYAVPRLLYGQNLKPYNSQFH